jgi:hypothetical protein
MDRRTLDRLVPLLYAGVLLISILFWQRALAANAIFGALAMTLYYTTIRSRLVAAERARDEAQAAQDATTKDEDGRGSPIE